VNDVVFVDTNIIVYATRPASEFHERAAALLKRFSSEGALKANDVVFAELCSGYPSHTDALFVFETFGIEQVRSSRESLFRASRAFMAYRRAGGTKASPLPDFFIGADALTAGVPLLTNDTSLYTTYFPDLELISP